MTSKEALEYLTIEATTDFQKSENSKSNCFKWQKVIQKDLEVLEFIKTHYEMNGFNELIPLYLDCDDAEKFNEIERWLEKNE